MPESPVTDRFDDLPFSRGRVGAHRAENPRLNRRAVLLWAALATVVLVGVGVFGSLVASGRIVLSPAPTSAPTDAPTEDAPPPVDTSFFVLVLNATAQDGLAAEVAALVTAAGWPSEMVDTGDAQSTDFATTTVYYPFAEAEEAARALANAIGGAEVALSDVYQPLDDPATTDDESQFRQLVVVVGLDRAAPPAEDGGGDDGTSG